MKKKSDKKNVNIPKKILKKVELDLELLKTELRNDVAKPVVASFGFIIALVWRDAISAAIAEYLRRAGMTGQEYIYNFYSAVLVTIVVIFLMMSITKLSRKRKRKKIERLKETSQEVKNSVNKN